jgi:hypothetical protein
MMAKRPPKREGMFKGDKLEETPGFVVRVLHAT